jgi:hypothetical protein
MEDFSMQEKNTDKGGLPPRPGEPVPGDVGKKGGDAPGDGPIVDEPTGLPGRVPGDVRKAPSQIPTA